MALNCTGGILTCLNPNSYYFSTDKACTFSWWMNLTAWGANNNIFRQIGTANKGLYIVNFGRGTEFQFYTGGASYWYSAEIPVDSPSFTGTWGHVAITYDGLNAVGSVKMYLNGVSKAVTTGGTTGIPFDNSTRKMTIMQSGVTGKISEVRIYSSVLTQAQIQSDMYRRIIPQSSGMVTYLRLDEGAIDLGPGSTTAVDLSGSGWHGDDSGAVSYTDGPPITWNLD